MRTVIVIPARLAALRLPNKPLAALGGLPLVVRVARQAERVVPGVDAVVIATGDGSIADAARAHGVEVVLTSGAHASGTDRVAEAAAGLDAEVIVNLQGDEPFVDPRDLRRVIDLLAEDPGADIATLERPIADDREWRDPDVVKVVSAGGRALYFTRAPIPHDRSGAGDVGPCRAHVGVYAYRAAALARVAQAPVDPLEAREGLEQLRALALGMRIAVAPAGGEQSRAIDNEADLAWARERVERLGEDAFPSPARNIAEPRVRRVAP